MVSVLEHPEVKAYGIDTCDVIKNFSEGKDVLTRAKLKKVLSSKQAWSLLRRLCQDGVIKKVSNSFDDRNTYYVLAEADEA